MIWFQPLLERGGGENLKEAWEKPFQQEIHKPFIPETIHPSYSTSYLANIIG